MVKILVFESEFTDSGFEIQINQRSYKIDAFSFFGNGVNVLSMGTLLFILVVAYFGVDSLYGNYQCV